MLRSGRNLLDWKDFFFSFVSIFWYFVCNVTTTNRLVFVFLTQENGDQNGLCQPEGKVLALPAGACVLDALRETERTLGLPLPKNQGFALNGIETSITRQLQNGDILGIQCPTRSPVMVA